ncbi:hypothetical protein RvY_14169-2 [Ramazzottius varieornatus]|uniref:Uncharacterized protein n=1 Tax=Ramazzottius varieornatus TaxID=947166 RepID=A0A1D1VS33_RAMVA|nr:hypothetical protein RvY_14169-2 [Ramazzottius varieornatus]
MPTLIISFIKSYVSATCSNTWWTAKRKLCDFTPEICGLARKGMYAYLSLFCVRDRLKSEVYTHFFLGRDFREKKTGVGEFSHRKPICQAGWRGTAIPDSRSQRRSQSIQ